MYRQDQRGSENDFNYTLYEAKRHAASTTAIAVIAIVISCVALALAILGRFL